MYERSDPCLSEGALARLAEGRGLGADEEDVLDHVSRCAACGEALAGLLRRPDESAAAAFHPFDERKILAAVAQEAGARKGRQAPLLRRFSLPLAAAAALLLLSAVQVWRMAEPGAPVGGDRKLSKGQRIDGGEVRIRTDRSELRLIELPDGSRFRVGEGSDVRFASPSAGGPPAGERLRVELACGDLDADVVKGGGQVRIVSEAGEILVLGTCFHARAFRIYRPAKDGGSGFEAVPVLAVTVSQGSVKLAGSGGSLRVEPGRRGILWGGGAPLLQEVREARGTDWRKAALLWGAGWRSPDFAGSVASVTLLAGDLDGMGGWGQVLGCRGESIPLRRIAAVLAGLSAESKDSALLLSCFRGEPDAEARQALLPHLVRVAGQEAVETILTGGAK